MIHVNKRKWLNPVGHWDSGALSYSVSADRYGEDNQNLEVNGDFSVWDCSKKIVLDFSYTTKKEYKQRLKKVRTLIDSLEELELALTNAGVEYED